MTAFIAAVLGHISESSSQINENQAEDWAFCLSVQQCRSNSLLDAHQGAMPSPSHFQLSSLLLPLRLCKAVPPWFFPVIPYLWTPHLATSWIVDLSASSYCPAQPSNAAGAHSPGCNIPSLPQDPAVLGRQTPLSHSDPIKPDSASLCTHPQPASTKRDSCLFFQAWRTQEAVLAAKPFLKALSDAAVCKPSSISQVGWRFPRAV